MAVFTQEVSFSRATVPAILSVVLQDSDLMLESGNSGCHPGRGAFHQNSHLALLVCNQVLNNEIGY